MKKIIFLPFFIIALNSCSFFEKTNGFGSADNWSEYLGGKDRNHYSKLDQITSENVKNLKIAWEYSLADSGQLQTNPLVIDGVLYGITPAVQAFAVDAATGKEIWKFGDPNKHWSGTGRGLSYWENGTDKRILFTSGPSLWAVSAATGKPIESFGEAGKVDLHNGLPASAKDKFINSNTPGTVFENLIIMPTRVSEDADAAPGDIRAFDIVTGKLAWTFHTIPYPGEFGYETNPANTYKNTEVGAANSWSGMSVDVKRGLLFVPTGSMAYDFFGGARKGSNLFANTLLALDARTGKLKWHYQFVKHDIWDRDLPAPPNLITLKHNGKMVDAVAQITKNAYVYIFNRETGEPLHPFETIKAPKSDLPGEETWPSQTLPKWPLPFSKQSQNITEKDISPYAENKEELLKNFRSYKRGLFDAPSLLGTLLMPGFDGGGEWGGAAIDPQGIMYVNASEMAWVITMKATEKTEGLPLGEKTYKTFCVGCHQADRKGNAAGGYPSLIDIEKRLDHKQLLATISNGRNRMPGFGFIDKSAKQALVQYLSGLEKKEAGGDGGVDLPYTPFKMTGYNKFLDNRGLSALAPPWGTLNAIDLNTGKHLWKVPLGDEPLLKKEGITGTGSETYGGGMVTASGLVFIAATKDATLRAFDAKTGKMVWSHALPAANFANPSTYMVNGKQYIALACGGTKLGTPKGNKYVAFALE